MGGAGAFSDGFFVAALLRMRNGRAGVQTEASAAVALVADKWNPRSSGVVDDGGVMAGGGGKGSGARSRQ